MPHFPHHKRAQLRLGTVIACVGLAAACATSPEDQEQQEAADSDLPAPPDGFPSGPITLTVSYPAGGGMDVTARTLADVAEEVTGREFRVQNREGASGLVGHTYLAQQAPDDGSEIGVVANTIFDDILLRDAEFSVDDFAPVSFIGFDPLLTVVSDESAVAGKDFDGVINAAADDPEGLRFGSVPPGMWETAIDVLEVQKDVSFNRVPYDGGDPAVTDLLGGNIDIFTAFYAEVQSHLDAGKIDVIGVLDNTPDERLPDVPTYDDLGVEIEDATLGASRFVTVPPSTDQEIQTYLSELFHAVLSSEAAKKRFNEIEVPIEPKELDETTAWYDKTFDTMRELNG